MLALVLSVLDISHLLAMLAELAVDRGRSRRRGRVSGVHFIFIR
jgi:hypothetical protein